MKYDFAGYATRNDLKCSDGRIIRDGAFKECDGMTVPLVWNHDHNSMNNVLGHAVLEYRPGSGMYTYGKFNDSFEGQNAKLRVENGDITSLSIYANQLQQQGPNVIHGAIREVSLVLAGANPGAYIEEVIAHSEEDGECVQIYSGEEFSELEGEVEFAHADKEEGAANKEETLGDVFNTLSEKQKKAVYAIIQNVAGGKKNPEEKPEDKEEKKDMGELSHADEEKEETKKGGKTIGEVFNTLSEEQKNAVYAMIGYLMDKEGDDGDKNKEEDKEMKHNVFDNYGDDESMDTNELAHSMMNEIINDGQKFGSLKESFLAHTDEYGITNIGYLFPEAKNQNMPPEIIDDSNDWVKIVMGAVHRTPFSRVKSMFADITEDEARAKGYIKGHFKKNEVFKLLRRSTIPTTVYKKQKLDRDDVADITDFDVVAWLRTEMRRKLDEELARAFLIGDGRAAASDDKIDESCIRPIWTDADLFTIKANVSMAGGSDPIKNFIDTCVLARANYKGSGNPTLFTTEAVLTRCLLLEDGFAHRLYKSEAELASALRVSKIVTVGPMEGVERTPDGGSAQVLLGLIVNLADYNVGADRGGQVNMFDDFDIDYNQQKYLIETRCSGAMTKPFAAIAIEGSKSTYNSILSPMYFKPMARTAIDAMDENTVEEEEEQNDQG